MLILLTPKEETAVLRPANGTGGPNTLFRKLQRNFDKDTKLLALDTGDIQKIYTNAKPHIAGYQDRCCILKAALEELKANPCETMEPDNEDNTPNRSASSTELTEGAPIQTEGNRFERNPTARKKCLEHYGFSCQACGITLSHIYGEIAEEFIHVHHIIPLSSIRASYRVDPVKDLRPVCPNCHSILHRKQPAISIQELSRLIGLSRDA